MAFDITPPLQTEHHPPHVEIELRPKRRFWPRVLGWFSLFLILGLGFLVVKAGTTFNIVSERVSSFLGIDAQNLPTSNPRERNRTDVLLLGFRGEGDPHGGLLTDTLMVVSLETEKQEAALISIPRDLYVTLPIVNQKTKINEAYAIGEEKQRGGGGLVLSKLAVQDVLGINIDYVVAVDFRAFQDTIDLLDGVEVNVAKPLHETQQWGGIDFYVPAGRQHMDGEKALFYVRSRFTTSDFDRSRRQQEVLLAVGEKALSLGFLGNPAKVADLLDILGRHVRTDMTAGDLPNLFSLVRSIVSKTPRQLVLDTNGFLRSAVASNGAYILLPAHGSFDVIRERAQNIFSGDTPPPLPPAIPEPQPFPFEALDQPAKNTPAVSPVENLETSRLEETVSPHETSSATDNVAPPAPAGEAEPSIQDEPQP